VVHPVPGSVLGKWVHLDVVFVDAVAKMEKDTEGCLGKCSVCIMGVNMEAGKIFCRVNQSARRQEFLDRKMGKLNNWTSIHIDHGNKTGTCRKHSFLCVLQLPICVIPGELSAVEANRKKLCKFVDMKGADGNGKALEQSVGKFSFLLLYPE
jgi:hypothetical protein